MSGPGPAAFLWREPEAGCKCISTSTCIMSASGTRKGQEENQAFLSARAPTLPREGCWRVDGAQSQLQDLTSRLSTGMF